MMRAMCEVKMIEITLLVLKATLDGLAMASKVRWYGHVLRRELNFEVAGKRGRGRPIMTWKRHTNPI